MIEQRPDWDDLPHTEWSCSCCGAVNSCHDADCQFCDAATATTTAAGFHSFVAGDSNEYGSFEVFRLDDGAFDDGHGEVVPATPGWYWWACFPGCLPDGEPSGPFDDAKTAYDDAQNDRTAR